MEIEIFNKASAVLRKNEQLAQHLKDLNTGVPSDIPLSVRKLGGKEIYLKPEFFNYRKFIKEYEANIQKELKKLNCEFNEI